MTPRSAYALTGRKKRRKSGGSKLAVRTAAIMPRKVRLTAFLFPTQKPEEQNATSFVRRNSVISEQRARYGAQIRNVDTNQFRLTSGKLIEKKRTKKKHARITRLVTSNGLTIHHLPSREKIPVCWSFSLFFLFYKNSTGLRRRISRFVALAPSDRCKQLLSGKSNTISCVTRLINSYRRLSSVSL